MNCPACGTLFQPRQKFCGECGQARPRPQRAPRAAAAVPTAVPTPAPAPAVAPAPATAVAPAAPTGSTTAVTAARLLTTPRTVAPGAGQLALVGPYAFAGAALVIAGSLMPLFSTNGLFGSNGVGESSSTWEIPAGFMFSDSPDASAFKLGLLLLAAALVLVPYLTGRPLTPMVLLLAAAPAGNVALGIYVRKLRADVYPNFGLGMVAIMAGAILIAAEALIPCWAAVKAQAE